MKVLHESADRLVLAGKSSLIWKALKHPIFFSLLGLAPFIMLQNLLYTGKHTTLTCSRPENYVDCKLEQKDAKGNQTIVRNTYKVKKALVREEKATRTSCTGSGENRSCESVDYQICHVRLVGETVVVEIPDIRALASTTETGCYSTSANLAAQSINKFISDKTTAPPLIWRENTTKGNLVSEISTLIGLAIGGSLIGYCIYLFNLHNSVWTFDKKTGKLIHNCQKLWEQSTQEYSLSNVAGISYKNTNSKTSNCDVFLWYRDGENLRHTKLDIAKGERLAQGYLLVNAVRPFCDKDYQIVEWEGDRAYGEHNPTLLRLCLEKIFFSSHYLSVICADKKQNLLTVRWEENANVSYRCILSQVTQIQVHKQEFKDSDGDTCFMQEVFLDLNGETVSFPIYENIHAGSFILQPMKFLAEFLNIPIKEIEK